MTPHKKQRLKYIFSDFLTSMIAWLIFFFFRRLQLDAIEPGDPSALLPDTNLYLGISILPFFWLFIFQMSGFYKNVLRKSRFNEFSQTLFAVLFGSIVLFFALLLDDVVSGYSIYYLSLLSLFIIQFTMVYIPRFLITSSIKNTISSGKNGFNTIIIGDGKDIELSRSMLPSYLGNILLGVVNTSEQTKEKNTHGLTCLGTIKQLDSIIFEHKVEEVILSDSLLEKKYLSQVLNILYRHNTCIKVTPKLSEKLIGLAKLNPIYGTDFMEIAHELMPPFEENLKRIVDVLISSTFLILFFPVYLFLAIRVLLGSPGTIFYKQTRVGKNGHPFKIIKFRTMVMGAEKEKGPQLSSIHDERITKFGRIMRKYRLDELPQFWNVIIGDMSVVGPRPERPFFVDQIVKKDPNYYALQKVKPGITSLGMVKYGYADNVEKMLDRLKYDLIYLENMSVLYDLKIFFYTLKTIITGKGV